MRTAVLFAAFAIAHALASPALAQRHPLYDDQGTLVWHTKLDAAKAAARESDKLIFVEIGTKT
jgi:hypothetical protein